MKYVLDANVYINAHQSYYSFDIVPGFWRILTELANRDQIVTIDKIKDELTPQSQSADPDPLHKWILSDFSSWCMSTDQAEVIESYRSIMQWAFTNPLFLETAKTEFATAGDSWLVAYAKVHGYTVVTLEKYNRDKRNRILIPNVCMAFGVPCIDTFEMMRTLGARIL
ncbi:twitching motility protein PilT [Paenibacillus sp. J53TS2]|uniref:DUF4411 family protein n=1 Tax=Paenibacillus sp. J53TS2 TaxID=2807197 RepID=UPI001B171B4F|nr:DUF4411 family protein [Paenibacillus sp. J53TS2]GIP49000.1 twitching motility protein PilT [Paenibacillus sp. J53TS2]